ncbi:hypothetical protein [Halorubrum sp. Boch-26]|uniref:hypothetical protein n=1 Tax=Halorubrum sp. Boch-26 TaxID=2994426 RepID=UPI0024686C40|nr:hypothetical protein [Halorubrum sp. Boch-26]
MRGSTTAILLVAVVALGAMTGVAAADGHLQVSVDDADGESTVTVTENGTAVGNATVNVSVADPANESYGGTGEYATDENGTVTLEPADEDVTVDVTAEYDNETASTSVDLEAPVDLGVDVSDTGGEPVVTVTDDGEPAENATVSVATADGQNATYVGAGDYETDENGTVGLPAAEENVTVDVTATYGSDSVSTTVELTAGSEAGADQPFGLQLREFIRQLQDREGGIGAAVSDFVTGNNPGNAPDHAGGPGGPDDAGNNSTANETDTSGNDNAPDSPGQGNGGERGAPDRAGNGDGEKGNNGSGPGNGDGNSGSGPDNGDGNSGSGPDNGGSGPDNGNGGSGPDNSGSGPGNGPRN